MEAEAGNKLQPGPALDVTRNTVRLLTDGGSVARCKYVNNVVEQDHRFVKQRVWWAKGYGSFSSAWRTLQGIEAVNMIRKGRARPIHAAHRVEMHASAPSNAAGIPPERVNTHSSWCTLSQTEH
jgi:DDE domain